MGISGPVYLIRRAISKMKDSPEMKEAVINRLLAETELMLQTCKQIIEQGHAKACEVSDAIEKRLQAIKANPTHSPEEQKEVQRLLEAQKDAANLAFFNGEGLDENHTRTTNDSARTEPKNSNID